MPAQTRHESNVLSSTTLNKNSLLHSHLLPCAPLPHPTTQPYWDNAATNSIVNDPALLYDLRRLANPIPVEGIGGHTPVTHAGKLNFLPETNHMNHALYGPKLTNNLISLGYIQSKGGDYHTLNNNAVSIRPDSDLNAPAHIVHRTSNNLLPVDVHALQKCYGHAIATPTVVHNPLGPKFLVHTIPPGLPPPSYMTSTAAPPPISLSMAPLTDLVLPVPTTTPHLPTTAHRLNVEQIRRANLANELHFALDCIPDDALITNLSLGKIPAPWNILTSADVRHNRQLRPVCTHCIAGRICAPPAPSSTSAPATRPGQRISWDAQTLPTKVHGGYTQKNTIVEEHANYIRIEGALSKSHQHLYNSLAVVIQDFNSHNLRVEDSYADPEKCNIAMGSLLKAQGITLAVAIPTHFARRVERTRRLINERARAVHDRLPYHLPSIYNLLLDQAVAHNLNRTVNERSYPLTPEEAITGKRSPIPLAFGRAAMVRVPIDKRTASAALYNQEVKLEPKAEVGVAVGTCPNSGATLFVVANGKIVPRHWDSSTLLPAHFIPFNWQRKIYVPNTEPILPPTPSVPSSTTSDYTFSPNSVVQHIESVSSRHAHALASQSISQHENLHLLTDIRRQTGHILLNPSARPVPSITPQLPNPPLLTPTAPPELLPPPHPPPALPPSLPTDTAPQATPAVASILRTHAPIPSAARPAPLSMPPPSPAPPLRMSSRTPIHAPGFYRNMNSKGLIGRLQLPILNHYDRKLLLSRAATLRDRNYRLDLHSALPSQKFSNLPTPARPIPALLQHIVHSLPSAGRHMPTQHLKLGMAKEMHKVFDKYKAMRLITPSELETRKAFLPSLFAIKPKPTADNPNDIRVRLALNGARQPEDSFGNTHAGTSDQTHRTAAIAMALADSVHRGKRDDLRIINFDLPSAFINNNPLPREKTGGYQLFTRLPESDFLPPEYSGQLAELTGAMNGIKQANNIFDQSLRTLYISNGYLPCPSSEYTFRKASPTDPHDYLIVSMGVDDGEIITTSSTLLAEFQKMIVTRYGHVDFIVSSGMCGAHYTYHDDGGISLDYGPYIRRMLNRIGMSHIEPTLTPSLSTFFDPPTDSTPASAAEHKEFQKINGELIFILPLRPDVRMEIVALCKSNSQPTKSDIEKQFHLIRYLCGCPDIGLTLSADPTDYPDGVEFTSSSDAGHNTNIITAATHSACTVTCGPPGARTSPFLAHSASDSTGGSLPLNPMEAEYVTLSLTAKQLSHYRQFAEDLGFRQHKPSIMLEDNASAIKLANSPQIPARSRHINLKFHHVRREIQRNEVKPQHQGTHNIMSDGMTKITSPSRFLFNRSQLFPKLLEQLRNSKPYYIKPI